MKKKELEKLEKINEERMLSKEAKNEIAKKILNNSLIALNLILLFVIFIIISIVLNKEKAILTYKISSFALLFASILLFEIAYAKDNDNLAINGIELLFASIITLLIPYTFIKEKANFNITIGCFFIVFYYIIKSIVVYNKQKNKFVLEQSDIPQIIKKESQDEMAQEEKEKIKEEKQKEIIQKAIKKKEIKEKTIQQKEVTKKEVKPKVIKQEEAKPKRKRGRPRKVEQKEQEPKPKRKRGRPKKIKE